MEEHEKSPPPPAIEPARSRGDGWLVLGLLLLAGGIRFWLIAHTTVTARDSIGFIRYAWQLEHQPWTEVIRGSAHPPGYPLVVLAMSVPVRSWFDGPQPLLMQLSAQLASALAGTLLVIPMFYLGKELFDRKVGFWAAVLFQCLPVAARVTTDALSEATFLLFSVTALLLAVRALRTRSPLLFALCGLSGALAYWIRPEGLLVCAAAGLVLLAVQIVPAWRFSWKKTVFCAASLGLATMMAVGPYVAITGRLTNKPTALRFLSGTPGDVEDSEPMSKLPAPQGSDAGQVASVMHGGPLLAVTFRGRLDESGGPWWAMWALGIETVKDFHYLAWLPALVGLWLYRHRLRLLPGAWVLLVLCLLQGLIVWGVALMRGYVSERHTLILVLCGTLWAVAAVSAIGRRLGRIMENPPHPRPLSPLSVGRGEQEARPALLVEAILLLALVGFGLPEVLKPLHTNRAGHRTAGLWLAEHAQPADTIVDPYCWAHYHSGKVFLEGTVPSVAEDYQPVRYVVLEHSKNEHLRLPLVPEAQRWAQQGLVVYHCPLQERKDPKDEVVVYRVPGTALP